MFDIRPILLLIGILLTTLGIAMLVTAAADALSVHAHDWLAFLEAAAVTLFVGIGLWIVNLGYSKPLNLQQAFVLTAASWVAAVAFAAIPFTLAAPQLSYTDAFFEAMSGLTTTGSTVMTDLDNATAAVLIWRALLQWMGGIGIIVMAVAVLPMLQVGGMQLFRLESSDTSEKIVPRATEFASAIGGIYILITLLCFFGYTFAGMPVFDAIAHAMTTIATGGFSTYDASIGHFDNAAIDMVAILFMMLGSLPFGLYLLAARGRGLPLFRDPQVQIFLVLVALISVGMAFYLVFTDQAGPQEALRYASFNVVSVITGTGYATTDYNAWGPFAVTALFLVMFIGGCAGSTSCGIKIFRFHVMANVLISHLRCIVHPHGVFTPRYGNRTISDDVITSVMSFFFLFFALFIVIAALLSIVAELDPLTALSAAGTALANVGPGLGEIIGPAGNFAPLSDFAKWLLSLAMLLGRLELFTVLVLFTPVFWRH